MQDPLRTNDQEAKLLRKAVFLGHNALGDTLCTTPVVRAFRRANPDLFLIYVVQNASFCQVLEGNPDVDLVIYNESMFLYGLTKYSREWFSSLPLDIREPATLYHFDINQVCQRAEAFTEHISVGFSRLLQIPIESVKPVVVLGEEQRRVARLLAPAPYAVVSMHSVANPRRAGGEGGVKDWPLAHWEALTRKFHGAGLDVIAVGSEKDPQAPLPNTRNLYGLPIRVVAALLEGAQCFVTVENGLGHLAAAVDAPTVELYSPIIPLAWANPVDSPRTRVLYKEPADIPLDEVWSAVEDTITQGVSR